MNVDQESRTEGRLMAITTERRAVTETREGAINGTNPAGMKDRSVSTAKDLAQLEASGSVHKLRGSHVYFVPESGEPFGHAEPLSLANRFAKRTLDLLAVSALLVVCIPVVLVAAIAIKLDSTGPVFFLQSRVGRKGRIFRMVKLRTMFVNNDESAHADYVARLIRGEAEQQEGGMFKLTDDPRITKVGRVLRKLSIDELPQVFNILRGDMSMVGPRPALPREVELYDQRAMQRLVVRPGLTGLWQVSGRSELSFQEMVDLDIAYWQRWSLLNELKILLKTPAAVLAKKGAA